jgi:hypothetical protein
LTFNIKFDKLSEGDLPMWTQQDPRLNIATPVQSISKSQDLKEIEDLIKKHGNQKQMESFKEIISSIPKKD